MRWSKCKTNPSAPLPAFLGRWDLAATGGKVLFPPTFQEPGSAPSRTFSSTKDLHHGIGYIFLRQRQMGSQGKVIGDLFLGDPKNTINTFRSTSKHKPLSSHFPGHVARMQCNYRKCRIHRRIRRNLLEVYRILEMERTLKDHRLQPLRCVNHASSVLGLKKSLSPLPTFFFLDSNLNRDQCEHPGRCETKENSCLVSLDLRMMLNNQLTSWEVSNDAQKPHGPFRNPELKENKFS